MKSPLILLLSGSALVSGAAFAQTVSPPVRWQDTPHANLHAPAGAFHSMPQAGVTWHQSGPVGGSYGHAAPPPMMHGGMGGPMPPMMHPGMPGEPPPMHMGPHGGPPPMDGHHMGGQHMGGMGWDHNFQHQGHIGRGGMIDRHWRDSRFRIRNWGLYGFPAPYDGAEWIRYYDDALLVGADGRVLDGRYGMDWDRYGERWNQGDDGAPGYADGDYGRSEGYGYDDAGPPVEDYGRDGHDRNTRVIYRHPGYGYYGYGAPSVTITETTVTEPATVVKHTYYESVAPRHGMRHHYRAKAPCGCAPPPPPPPVYDGERG